MSLNDPDLFLLAADQAANVHEYFHWPVVGKRLHWREARSKQAVESLHARNLVATRGAGETRFLPAGRQLARRLAAAPVPDGPRR
jgi:hypothetical protein